MSKWKAFETFQCHVLNKYEFRLKEKFLQQEPDSSANKNVSDVKIDSNYNQVPMTTLYVAFCDPSTSYFSPATEAELTEI
jgi:hypothetical protein